MTVSQEPTCPFHQGHMVHIDNKNISYLHFSTVTVQSPLHAGMHVHPGK